MNKLEKVGLVVRKVLSVISVLLGILVLSILIFMYGRGETSDRFFYIYTVMGSFLVIMGVITFIVDFAAKIVAPDSLLGKALYTFDRSTLRPLSLLVPAMIAAPIIYAIMVSLVVSGSGLTLYSPPNPYSESLVLQDNTFSQHGSIQNIFLGAVVPALFEEAVIFYGIQAAHFIVLLIIALIFRDFKAVDNPFVFWIVLIPILFAFSALFAYGHGRFGGDGYSYLRAFSFEFIAQSLNQVTGGFLSWIPHFAHNTVVIAQNSFSVAVS